MKSKKIRVRFAPSPTGTLHIGGVRTALYNYLFAKKHGGDFIVRIEDTDQKRYVKTAEKYILEALDWCKINPDESPEKEGKFAPYRQSDRKEIYKAHIAELIKKGAAYYAFDTAEKLEAHREEHQKKGKTFIYNWHNRIKLDNSLGMTVEEINAKIERGCKYVVRFLTPLKTIKLKDKIRGEIVIDTRTLDDKILYKSDGMPTYHFANVIDDHLMQISHVIRGEEWLPSLALHILLYESLEWTPPIFAHLPLILKPTGKGKLSKRDGVKGGFPVFPLDFETEDGEILNGFREMGYEPEAFVNMLAMLGWNDGTAQEVFSTEELIEKFSLGRVQSSGAKFNPEKAKWYNAQYIQQKSTEEIYEQFALILKEKNIDRDKKSVLKMIDLVKERAVFIKDFWELTTYFFNAPDSYNEKAVKKVWKAYTGDILTKLCNKLKEVNHFKKEYVEETIKPWASEIGMGKVMQPLRLSLVGAMKGCDIFELMEVIEKEETLKRIENAIKIYGN